MAEEEFKLDTGTAAKQEPRITIEIRPGRWGKIFHLFDVNGAEVVFHQKEALKLARTIIKEAGKKS